MSTHYRHLSLDDRIQIEILSERGVSRAEIARRIGVHRSTITRELSRGSWQPEHDHANLRPYLRNKLDTRTPHQRLYLAGQAHLQSQARAARSHQPYRMEHDPLVHWVISHLRRGWTPEEIAGRLGAQFPDDPRMRASPETLYAWIYSPNQAHRELWQYLERGQKKRRRIKGRNVQTERIKHRVSIHDRPVEIESREEFGHWESDSVLGARGTGALHTSVERTSRYYVAIKIPQVAAAPTLHAQLDYYQGLPAHAVKSITVDNGSEFAHHHQLADTIGVPTYFCDPYSAFQRGSNEHFNRRIRRYLPKGTSFTDLTQEELDEYVWEINNRPRKILDWATPAEIFDELSLT
ncbi:IS30 family transposase [Citricoccus sp. NR2]|uniref:IS30 family transposase n=1 Tax=Citricoccus sp. NR2 TaxID=3004095 RepID=UPI0022DDA425|nr:IS30 family transposase [Citricoccus sp. NR2]WBL19631.1 IS30 family transposase [Citricoccus sp. NR2]WBL20535.1 IS30 family transposase [Citricoccus sp. NR2]